MPAERIEHRAVASGDRRERGLVHRREVIVLGERIDRQLPVDRTIEHLFAKRCPAPDAPRVQLVGQRAQVRRDIERAITVERNPQEACAFGGRQLCQSSLARTSFGKAFFAGHSNQVAIEVVGPRVIRTREPPGAPAIRHDLRLAVQAYVVECAHLAIGAAGQQDRAAHHRLGAVGAWLGQLRHIADELGAGHQHRGVLSVARRRGVGIRSNGVLGRIEIGGLVPRELDRAAREVDEQVAIHVAIIVVFIMIVTSARVSNRQSCKIRW
jgi:hypothetical protein